MGNCLAPDLYSTLLTDTLVPHYATDISFLCRYVDDLLFVINPKKLADILNSFNSYHPRLQFTVEIEQDQKLPCLDILIFRQNDGNIIIDS